MNSLNLLNDRLKEIYQELKVVQSEYNMATTNGDRDTSIDTRAKLASLKCESEFLKELRIFIEKDNAPKIVYNYLTF